MGNSRVLIEFVDGKNSLSVSSYTHSVLIPHLESVIWNLQKVRRRFLCCSYGFGKLVYVFLVDYA